MIYFIIEYIKSNLCNLRQHCNLYGWYWYRLGRLLDSNTNTSLILLLVIVILTVQMESVSLCLYSDVPVPQS